MSEGHYRYSMTRRGALLDSLPMKDGGNILVFDTASKSWVTWTGGTVGEWHDSIPVTSQEAAQFCKDGSIPEHLGDAIRKGTEAPDPEDD